MPLGRGQTRKLVSIPGSVDSYPLPRSTPKESSPQLCSVLFICAQSKGGSGADCFTAKAARESYLAICTLPLCVLFFCFLILQPGGASV